MTVFSKEERVFLELYKIGAWGVLDNIELQAYRGLDWKEILRLARSQTVIGIVVEGIARLKALDIPKEIKLKFFGHLIRIQQQNERLNAVLPVLYKKLGQSGIVPVLLKGQGVAQNYINPMARQAGDIDLYISDRKQFDKAYRLFQRGLKQTGELNGETLEAAFLIENVPVELHGRILSSINRRLEENFPAWRETQFARYGTKQVSIGSVAVDVPATQFDVVFVFIHLARHYFAGGIGLRQICDWMRLLYINFDDIDREKLVKDLAHLGLEKSWSVFGTMAVDHLGYPKAKMPLYDEAYSKNGERVLRYVLDSGNFGFHDKRSKSDSKNYYIRRAKAFKGNLIKILRNFSMFPNETIYCLPAYIKNGLKRTKM